jgi:ribosomal protein S18 acetylase RimI-like enzyme
MKPPSLPTGKELGLGFDIIDIRRFEADDFSTLLEAESQAWYERLRWDFAASARVINACLREQRLSGYALVREGRIRGYCFFFYDGEKSVIGDLFVHPEVSGLGHEGRLLDHVLETLLATPGLRRIEAQLPHYEREDLQARFPAPTFQTYLRRFMRLPLENSPRAVASGEKPADGREKPAAHADIQLIPWERRFNDEASDLLYQAYQHHVDAIINDQYSSLTGSKRLIENIVNLQGCGEFLWRVSRLAVHRPSQRLAGILAVSGIRPHTAHIPQVAVAGPFQGLGVGTALMEAAFQDLPRQGFEEVTLTVTDSNAGAVRLYERLGFQTFKTFGAFIYSQEEDL